MHLKLDKNLLLNVDTVKFTTRYNGPPLKSSYMKLTDEGESVQAHKSNRMALKGDHERHLLHIRHDAKRNEMSIEGSLFGYLYGQNVFTSPDLNKAIKRVLRRVAKTLGLTDIVAEEMIAGPIRLSRVDVAVNFQFDNREAVAEVVAQACRQMIEHRCTVWKCETSTYWAPNKGRDYQFIFYAKGAEMAAHSCRSQIRSAERKTLMATADGLLRIELRLKTSSLKKHGVQFADAWSISTPKKLFENYFKLMPILDAPSGSFETRIPNLSTGLRRYLALHKSGAPLLQLYSREVIKRHQKSLRDVGIDMKVPYSPEIRLELGTLLSDKNLPILPPAWMRDSGILPKLRSSKTLKTGRKLSHN